MLSSAATDIRFKFFSQYLFINFSKKANAGEIISKEVFLQNNLGSQIDTPSLDPLPVDPATVEISQFISQQISDITKTDMSTARQMDLRKLSILEIESLSQSVSQKYNVKIDPSHWEYLKQSDGVAKYIASLQKIDIPNQDVKSWQNLQGLNVQQGGDKFIFVP